MPSLPRFHVIALLLPLLLAGTAAAAERPAASDAPRDSETGAVLWLEPVWPAALLLGGAGKSGGNQARNFYLPLGLSLPLAPKRALTLELSVGSFADCYGMTDAQCYARGRFGRLSVGYAFSSRGQQRGAFFQPRLALTVIRTEEVYGADRFIGPRLSPGADLGMDVGYQWRFKHLYAATMFGVGAGVFTNASDEGVLLTDRIYVNRTVGVQPTLTVNANLLRIGWGL